MFHVSSAVSLSIYDRDLLNSSSSMEVRIDIDSTSKMLSMSTTGHGKQKPTVTHCSSRSVQLNTASSDRIQALDPVQPWKFRLGRTLTRKTRWENTSELPNHRQGWQDTRFNPVGLSATQDSMKRIRWSRSHSWSIQLESFDPRQFSGCRDSCPSWHHSKRLS